LLCFQREGREELVKALEKKQKTKKTKKHTMNYLFPPHAISKDTKKYSRPHLYNLALPPTFACEQPIFNLSSPQLALLFTINIHKVIPLSGPK
jgi:hypothetical protein